MFSIGKKLFFSLIFLVSLTSFVKADPIRIISGGTSKNATSITGIPNTSIYFFSETPVLITTDPRWFYASGATANPVVDIFRLGPNGIGSYAYRTILGSNSILNGVSCRDLVLNTQTSNMIFTPLQTFTLPNAANSSSPFSVEFPFAMQGYLAGAFYPNGINAPGSSVAVNPININGTGTARLTFIYLNSQSAWSLSDFNYTFATPEPTPEPATILLLSTGLLGIAGYAKRRRKQKRTE